MNSSSKFLQSQRSSLAQVTKPGMDTVNESAEANISDSDEENDDSKECWRPEDSPKQSEREPDKQASAQKTAWKGSLI